MQSATLPIEQTWNLEDIYADEAAFAKAKNDLVETIPGLNGRAGRLAESAATLADALEAITEAGRLFSLLRCYASLRSDADTRVDAYQAARQEVELLATELSRKTAFLRPEILAMQSETVEGFIAEEPRLAPYAHELRDLMRQRTHVLSAAEERIMAEAGLLAHGADSLFQVLNSVELPRPEVSLASGESVRMTPVEFGKHRASPHRPDRLKVFPAYFKAYSDFKDTLGQNLFSGVKEHVFRARSRGYGSCLEAALDPGNIPVGVYRNLVEQVHRNLHVLHRYCRLRAGMLGLDRLEYPDLYCPLNASPARRYEPADAPKLVLRSMEPLGKEYVEALEAGFNARWIDWHATPGKRPGAYATGWAYHVHPYVLLNFIGDHDSVSTLAHEMGHAMHSYFSNRKQPFATADYSIFVAEVASTLNEALLSHSMLADADSDDEKLFLLGSQFDRLRGTLFRQTMFAEFELEIHERVERGEVLTAEILNGIYLDLLRRYHGHADGVVHIDERYAYEWAAIPHMYYNFYVYQYSTGVVAATALAEKLLSGDGDAQRCYLDFLSSGGSDYPLQLLRRAGADLESAEPYDSAFRAAERQLDLLESLTAR